MGRLILIDFIYAVSIIVILDFLIFACFIFLYSLIEEVINIIIEDFF